MIPSIASAYQRLGYDNPIETRVVPYSPLIQSEIVVSPASTSSPVVQTFNKPKPIIYKKTEVVYIAPLATTASLVVVPNEPKKTFPNVVKVIGLGIILLVIVCAL